MEKVMDFIHKMAATERDIAAEKGDFVLFALIKRAEGLGLWDIVLSARWFSADDKKTLDYITGKLREKLTPTEMTLISQIVLFPPADQRVQEILQLVQQHTQQPVTHGHLQLSSWTLSSMPISHAHIMTANTSQSVTSSTSISFPKSQPATGDTGVTQVCE